MNKDEENFNVSIEKSDLDDGTVVLTGFENQIKKIENEMLLSAVQNYNINKKEIYSVFPNDSSSSSNDLSLDTINSLAKGINTSLSNLEQANAIILQYINEDGLMGFTYNCIESNTPTDYTISYPLLEQEQGNEDFSNDEVLKDVKFLIESFNNEVKIKNVIKNTVAKVMREGNATLLLRVDNNSAVINSLPLAIAYPSGYTINGDDIIEFDVKTLKDRLSKTYKKNKKRKAIYFEEIKKEVKANYPKEVYQGLIDGENYVRLDTNYSGCIKINDMGRVYGVSPFFKALKPLVILNNLEMADIADSKARSKKIIVQILRKELMGNNGDKKGLIEQQLAHASLMSALKTNLCAYTAPAFVEKVEFVTSKSNTDDSSKIMQAYTTKYLQALGVSFIDTDISTYATSKVSLSQLLKTINCVIQSVEYLINKFYRTLIKANKIEEKYAPQIHIAKAETMELEIKKDLAQFFYSTLNTSLKTSYAMVGLDVETEYKNRIEEKKKGYDEVFTARQTAYTTGNSVNDGQDQNNGRPQSNDDEDKQALDKDYNNGV